MTTATTKTGGDSGEAVGWVGSLAHTPLPEVIRRIVLEERSGDLQVTSSTAIKTVYFDRGFIVFASSNLKSDRLGESMIEAGRISRQDFAVASMLMERGKRKFGQALVHAGIVSDEELGHHVATHVNRIVLSLFSVRQGMYSFDERPCIIPLELMVSLSVYRILIEGIRRIKDKRLILAGLPPLDTKLRISEAPPFTLDVEKLRRSERAVIRAIGKGASLQKIADTIGGNEGLVLRACYGLYAAGVLETGAPHSKSRIRRVQEETGTFKLSEIRRKIEKKRQEVAGTLPSPLIHDGPSQTQVMSERSHDPEPLQPTQPVEKSLPELELELELEPEPKVELETDAKGAQLEPESQPKLEPEPKPELEPEATLQDGSTPEVAAKETSPGVAKAPPAPTTEEMPVIRWSWSYVLRDFTGWVVAQIMSLFRRRRGIGDQPQALGLQEPVSPPREEQPPASPREPTPPAPPWFDSSRREPRVAKPPEKELAEPTQSKTESEPSHPGYASSERIDHEVKPKDLTKETVGIPSWSIKDYPDVPEPYAEQPEETAEEATEKTSLVESIGVPSWSLKDDPRDAANTPPDLYGKADPDPLEKTQEMDNLDAPSWSIQDGSTGPGDPSTSIEQEEVLLEQEPLIELDLEQGETPAPRPAPMVEPTEVLASMDSDLFVEDELEERDEQSMLSHIAVEEVKLDEESPEFEIEVDEAMFTDLPESVAERLLGPSVEDEEPVELEELPSTPAVEAEPETAEDLPPITYVESEPETTEPLPSISSAEAEPEQPPELPPISYAAADTEPEPTEEIFSTPSVSTEAEPGKPDGEAIDRPAAAAEVISSSVLPVPMPVSRPYEEPPPESGKEESASMAEHNQQALRIKQGGGEARLLRDVKLHFKFRDWDGAVRLLEQLVQISPGSALYRGMLGRAMSKHPMMSNNAEQHFIEALRLSPQDPQLHYWLGLYYKSFGLKSRAYNEFRTTLRIDRNHQGALKQLSEGGKRGDALGGVFKKIFG